MEDPLLSLAKGGLRLAAPRLAGSAAHPASPGPNKPRRRGTRRPQQPACDGIAPSGQRGRHGKDTHPDRRRAWKRQRSGREAGACRLNRPRMKPCPPQAECARGPSPNAAPAGARPRAGGTECVPSPAPLTGRYGAAPRSKGSGETARGLASRGRPSPLMIGRSRDCGARLVLVRWCPKSPDAAAGKRV